MQSTRTIYHPIQKDYVTFVETCEESGNRHTIVEVELAVGGGVGMHYHKTYDEYFECIEGNLGIQLGGKLLVLTPGETAVARKGVNHRFINPGSEVCRFRCKITPGCRGFEESMQIAYGLARDGKINKKGMPANLDHLSYLLLASETNLRGFFSVIEYFLKIRAKKAIRKGVANDLRMQYVRI